MFYRFMAYVACTNSPADMIAHNPDRGWASAVAAIVWLCAHIATIVLTNLYPGHPPKAKAPQAHATCHLAKLRNHFRPYAPWQEEAEAAAQPEAEQTCQGA
jgi:hypothetical protein